MKTKSGKQKLSPPAPGPMKWFLTRSDLIPGAFQNYS